MSQKIPCDKGKEFYNSNVKVFLRGLNITLFFAENSYTKCALAKRLIGTLKDRMFGMFRYKISTRYIDKPDDLLYSYSCSVHSSHEMASADVDLYDRSACRQQAYVEQKQKPPRYSVGHHVKISKTEACFEKGYEPRLKEKTFVLSFLHTCLWT